MTAVRRAQPRRPHRRSWQKAQISSSATRAPAPRSRPPRSTRNRARSFLRRRHGILHLRSRAPDRRSSGSPAATTAKVRAPAPISRASFAGKPVAVVHDTSRYGTVLAEGAVAALKQAGRGDVLTATIAGGQKDYGALVAKLAAAHTEAVFFAGFPIEGGLLLRQMRAARPRHRLSRLRRARPIAIRRDGGRGCRPARGAPTLRRRARRRSRQSWARRFRAKRRPARSYRPMPRSRRGVRLSPRPGRSSRQRSPPPCSRAFRHGARAAIVRRQRRRRRSLL